MGISVFSYGRMVKKDGAVQPEYHVNDYLCSVRVVTDARGEVLERNDYSGSGKRLTSIPASARMSTAMTIGELCGSGWGGFRKSFQDWQEDI